MRFGDFALLFYFHLSNVAQSGYAANILIFLIGTNQFERSNFEFLAQQLALRHHNVITMKPILVPEEPRLVQPRLHLVREKVLKDLLPKSLYEPLQSVGSDVPWRLISTSMKRPGMMLTSKRICRSGYELEAFNEPYWVAHNHSCWKMLNSDMIEVLGREQIDLAIVYSGNACQLGIVHFLGLPFVYFDVEGMSDETIVASGMNWDLSTHVEVIAESKSTSLWGALMRRLLRAWDLTKELIVQAGISPRLASWVSERYRRMDEPVTSLFAKDYYVAKRFKARGGFPDVNEIKQQAELYFLNTDKVLESPTQQWPSHVVPVGGHLDAVKPLFEPWNTSIANAKEGIILVSLGTQVDSSTMPLAIAQAMLEVFAEMKEYRIFWRIGRKLNLAGMNSPQFEEGLPSHINITTFFPQQELLANHRTKLLITNGGMNSIMEAVVHGVPMIGIPLYGANRRNLDKVQASGLGLVVQKEELDAAKLATAIDTVLRDTKFASRAKALSREFKNRPSTPLKETLHLIEHAARLKSADLYRRIATTSKLQRLYRTLLSQNLDVFALVLLPFIMIVLLLLYGILRLHMRLLSFASRRQTTSCQQSIETLVNNKRASG